jgi:hypothetical protein
MKSLYSICLVTVIGLSCGHFVISQTAFAAVAVDEPNVVIEVLIDRGLDVDNQRKWLEALQGIGATSVRMRSARGAEQVSLRNTGSKEKPSYQIIARLTEDGRLDFPSGKFRASQIDQLKTWVTDLKAKGPEEEREPILAFGLTKDQLLAVHQELGRSHFTSTKKRSVSEVVTAITEKLSLNVDFDGTAKAALGGEELVAEELVTLSAGTTLAAALRPLGLVMVPRVSAKGELSLSIVDVRTADEHWPVGWPIETTPVQAAPDIFKDLEIEITNAPIQAAFDALEKKSGVPFLYDHNGLARVGLDLSQTKVTVPSKKAAYMTMMKKVATQTKPKLSIEIRLDEASNPFLWISPSK